MKLTITFKDPDGVYEAVRHASYDNLPEGLSPTERDTIADIRIEEKLDALRKWVEYGEYLTVEFDLDAMTATVKEVA